MVRRLERGRSVVTILICMLVLESNFHFWFSLHQQNNSSCRKDIWRKARYGGYLDNGEVILSFDCLECEKS